ncbi:MAG TPA: Xaa-Pro peptidase family protein [Blastocatellia bacterium]|nr:Xaa-Pro peptidase family protein [Blastocatellia bacterium]
MKNFNRACRSRLAILGPAILFFIAPLFTTGARAGSDDALAGQPKADYRARRQNLLRQIKDGIVVLVGAREEDFGEVGRFRQKNDFMYLTGVDVPASYLMLVPGGVIEGKAAQETIFLPPRNPAAERWTGPKIGPGPEAQQRFGFEEVASSEKFQERLREILNSPPFKVAPSAAKPPARLYTVVPRGSTAPLTRENLFIETIRRSSPHVQVADISPILAEMRLVKSPAELALLQKAIDITGEAQRDTAATIRPGVFEYEVQAALEYAFARNGAERPGFPSIVGSGFYSTVLHYNENRKKIETGDLVVVDIGAEYSYYTADITRTYPASGKFTERQRQIYQLVLDAQRAAEAAFKPGQSTIGSLNRAAIQVMKASPLRDKAGNTLERYFIHGLGHWLGMDVHDVGEYGKPIPAGAVFTIEPGIYIPDEKLGVRIEDDYLATEKGLVKLSSKIPSEPDAVEQMMKPEARSQKPEARSQKSEVRR